MKIIHSFNEIKIGDMITWICTDEHHFENGKMNIPKSIKVLTKEDSSFTCYFCTGIVNNIYKYDNAIILINKDLPWGGSFKNNNLFLKHDEADKIIFKIQFDL